MNKFNSASIFLIIYILIGCSKLQEGISFSLYPMTEVVIPSSSSINLPINLITPDITTDSESEFAANNTSPNLVRDIRLKELRLIIKSPEQTTFDFLRSARIYLSADGMPEIEIAFSENIPATGARNLYMDVNQDVNFKDYLIKDKVSMRVQATTRQLLTSDTKLEVRTEFVVRASVVK
ncbi:MAG: hypothetical protein ACK417_07080 [Bacteroidia bacterium]